MLFKEFGEPGRPVAMLVHGGGLSWWAGEEVIGLLREKYRVVAPILDGHGEDSARDFLSIEDSAAKLIAYVDERCGGRVKLLAGVSLGAQIVSEALSQRSSVAQHAVIESALVIPMKALTKLTVLLNKFLCGLLRQRWFSRAQAKALGLPDDMFQRYYDDSLRLSRQTLVGITNSNGNYALKPAIRKTDAHTLVVVGGKELRVMRSSARMLHEAIGGSELYVAEGMRHGELSLRHPDDYIKRVEGFIQAK
jgi:pimeloyl-ACP methyl ester carboxylesterase